MSVSSSSHSRLSSFFLSYLFFSYVCRLRRRRPPSFSITLHRYKILVCLAAASAAAVIVCCNKQQSTNPKKIKTLDDKRIKKKKKDEKELKIYSILYFSIPINSFLFFFFIFFRFLLSLPAFVRSRSELTWFMIVWKICRSSLFSLYIYRRRHGSSCCSCLILILIPIPIYILFRFDLNSLMDFFWFQNSFR